MPEAVNVICLYGHVNYYCFWMVILLIYFPWHLFRVSKGVRDLPGNFQSAASTVPSGKALMYFGLFLASGVFFIVIAFTMFLPVMVLVPQKFAICFTLGCCFIIGSFFALKGPMSQLSHMSSKEVSTLHFGAFSSFPKRFDSSWVSLLFIYCLCRGFLSPWDLLAAWSVPYMSRWCFTVISFLCSSLYCRYRNHKSRASTFLYVKISNENLADTFELLVGSCTGLLCHFILPRWVYRDEISLVGSYFIGNEMFWSMSKM